MRWLTDSKYHNEWVVVDGQKFQSKKEGNRWQELKLMERAGEIFSLARQVRIEIVPKTDKHKARFYVADFVYIDGKTGKTVYEDVKGYKRGLAYQMFTLKRDILYWRHGIEIKET